MFDEMLPGFWGDGNDLEKSFAGFNTDVSEKDGNYVLEAELPGFDKKDIHLDLKNDILTISAQHSEDKKEEDKGTKYIRKERRFSSYSRSFNVENIAPEDIDATYENGVLTVRFPKRDQLPEKGEKQIEIK